MRQWIGSALVKIMAWRRIGDKQLSEPMLGYRQLEPYEQTSVKLQSKYKTFYSRKCIWKCRLQNGGYVVQGKWVKYYCDASVSTYSEIPASCRQYYRLPFDSHREIFPASYFLPVASELPRSHLFQIGCHSSLLWELDPSSARLALPHTCKHNNLHMEHHLIQCWSIGHSKQTSAKLHYVTNDVLRFWNVARKMSGTLLTNISAKDRQKYFEADS